MATSFKRVKNNVKSRPVADAFANTTSPLTFALTPGDGAKFDSFPGNSYYITVTGRSTDNLTVTWGQLGTSIAAISGTPRIALLMLDQHLKDIHTAINAAEASIATSAADDANSVHQTGTETIGGVKTFSSSPIVPTPTTDFQASTKAYVDALLGGAGTGDMILASQQTVTGAKTFNIGKLLDKGNQIFNVKAYGAVGDGVASDSTAINAAITDANSAGGGIVFFPEGTYLANARIVPKSNVTLQGVGDNSIIKRSADDQIIVMTTGALDRFSVEFLRFSGPVNEFPTVPRRTRTVSGPGANFAIYLRGNQDPGTPGAGAISNFTLRNCTIENTTELPILLAGITGYCRVTDNNFVNNKDPGFIFNDEVIFTGNHCMYGADNGVSLSRGNKKVVWVFLSPGSTLRMMAILQTLAQPTLQLRVTRLKMLV